MLTGVRAALARIDRDQPVTRVRTMDTVTASLIPARRAAAVDPNVVLKSE